MTKVRKLGTGSVTPTPEGSRKWAHGVKAQVDRTGDPINTRLVPLGTISLDSNNPRRMAVNSDEVHSTSLRCPIPPAWLTGQTPASNDWDEFNAAVLKELSQEKAEDYLKLVLLGLSIRDYEGLINPITVFVGDSGTDLRLIAGERRYLAHVLLQQHSVVAKILHNQPTRFEIDLMQWHENNQREDLSLGDSILNVERLVKGWFETKSAEVSVRQLVALAGITQANAHRFLTVLKSPHKDAILSLIEGHQIGSLSKAATLASMSRAEFAAYLSPKPTVASAKTRFKIHKNVPLQPLQSLITQAALACGADQLVSEINTNPPATVEECAVLFENLLQIVEDNQAQP